MIKEIQSYVLSRRCNSHLAWSLVLCSLSPLCKPSDYCESLGLQLSCGPVTVSCIFLREGDNLLPMLPVSTFSNALLHHELCIQRGNSVCGGRDSSDMECILKITSLKDGLGDF